MGHDLTVLVPGPLETCTGGYAYDRQMIEGLRALGWTVTVRALDASFPHPTPRALEEAARACAGLDAGTLVLVDGLALGAMPEIIERASRRLTLAALVHHPLALETGLTPETAQRLLESERRALAAVRLVIVTSRRTAETLAGYGVAHAQLAVVEPGTTRAALSRGSGGHPLALLCVAAVAPRKGHVTLLRALARVADVPWRLTCVGSLARHEDAVARVRGEISALNLTDRVDLAGELDPAALAEAFDRADAFVFPTHYEGYGMAVAEAIAHGLPVISTPTGAIPDIVGQGGLLVPAGDIGALAGALHALLTDEPLRNRLADGARRARETLPTWPQSTDQMAAALIGAVSGGQAAHDKQPASFDAGWLDLREPVDHVSRSRALALDVVEKAACTGPLRAVDLATGTGANFRYLATLSDGPQQWVLVDGDPRLLAHIPDRLHAWASTTATAARCDTTIRQVDLSSLDDEELFTKSTLVTASALLDLVSEIWLARLVAICLQHRAAVLFALSYDGRLRCWPEEPEDDAVRLLVNRHQRRDKGFGPALGPDAGQYAVSQLVSRGYQVRCEASDWSLGHDSMALQQQLIDGWAEAATEADPSVAGTVASWRQRRLAHVKEHRSRVVVGHLDVGGWLR